MLSSVECQLIASPRATYARLVRTPVRMSFWRALRRPLIVLAVIAGSIALAATRHAPPRLVLDTAFWWSPIVAAQIAIALVVIAGPARRGVGIPRALDLFFAGHAPWSLWMLALVGATAIVGDQGIVATAVTGIVPFALTVRILAAFFREVLALDARSAVRRTIAHQAITWSTFLLVYGTAVALLPRIVQRLGW